MWVTFSDISYLKENGKILFTKMKKNTRDTFEIHSKLTSRFILQILLFSALLSQGSD